MTGYEVNYKIRTYRENGEIKQEKTVSGLDCKERKEFHTIVGQKNSGTLLEKMNNDSEVVISKLRENSNIEEIILSNKFNIDYKLKN